MKRQGREIPISLQLYEPQASTQTLRDLAVASGLVNTRRHFLLMPHLARDAQREHPAYFLEGRGAKRIEKANRAIYTEIGKLIGSERRDKESEGRNAWYSAATLANNVISDLINAYAKNDANTFGLISETATIQQPGEIMQLVLSEDTDPRLKFELSRQVGIALASMQIERQSQQVRHRVNQIQRVLDVELFNGTHKVGEGKTYQVHTLNDPNTNEILKAQVIDPETGVVRAEHASRDYIPNQTSKPMRYEMRMREIDGFGLVLTNPRVKDEREAAKKAVVRTLGEENGRIDAAKTVRDQGGLMFVVADEFYNNGEKVTVLMERFKEVMKKRFGLSDKAFVVRNHQRKNNIYTSGNNFRRMDIIFPDLGHPIEVIFTGLGDQLNRDNKIGQIDPDTGIPDGPAHTIYEARRNLAMFRLSFPPEVYGNYDFDGISRRAYEHVVGALKEPTRPEMLAFQE
ncbi:MAG: hypothetical protein KGL95_06925 [Patescibacteria group bacterium]|nr:hypothetical protein [Patescibacteria group bacterium]